MSRKKENDPLTGWDSLILIIMAGILCTTTMAIAAGLSWWWPVGYLAALFVAVPVSIKNDEKKAKEASGEQ